MARHVDLVDGEKADPSRSILLGSLHSDATRKEVAKEVKRLSGKKCDFFWPRKDPSTPGGGTHTGYCLAQFKNRNAAERAMRKISEAGLSIRGRPVMLNMSKQTTGSQNKKTPSPSSKTSQSPGLQTHNKASPFSSQLPGHWKSSEGPGPSAGPAQTRSISSTPTNLASRAQSDKTSDTPTVKTTRKPRQAAQPSQTPALLTMDALSIGAQGVRINGAHYVPALAAICQAPRGSELLINASLLPFPVRNNAFAAAIPPKPKSTLPQPRGKKKIEARAGTKQSHGTSSHDEDGGGEVALEVKRKRKVKTAKKAEEPDSHQKRIKCEQDAE